MCGANALLTSFHLHLRKCEAKFLAQQELKPTKDRLPVPPDPFKELAVGGRAPTKTQIDKANSIAASQGMVHCPHCARTFIEDRLSIHLKSCSADKPSRRVGMVRTGRGLGTTAPVASDVSTRDSRPHADGGAGWDDGSGDGDDDGGGRGGRPSMGGGVAEARARALKQRQGQGQGHAQGQGLGGDAWDSEAEVDDKGGFSASSSGRGTGGCAGTGSSTGASNTANAWLDEAGSGTSPNTDLCPCSRCGRTFTNAALARHAKACRGPRGGGGGGRSSTTTTTTGSGNPTSRQQPAKQSKWRQESSQFRDAMRAARGLAPSSTGGGGGGGGGEEYGQHSGLESCPHCGRSFKADPLAIHLRSCGVVGTTICTTTITIRPCHSRIVKSSCTNAHSTRLSHDPPSPLCYCLYTTRDSPPILEINTQVTLKRDELTRE